VIISFLIKFRLKECCVHVRTNILEDVHGLFYCFFLAGSVVCLEAGTPPFDKSEAPR